MRSLCPSRILIGTYLNYTYDINFNVGRESKITAFCNQDFIIIYIKHVIDLISIH